MGFSCTLCCSTENTAQITGDTCVIIKDESFTVIGMLMQKL